MANELLRNKINSYKLKDLNGLLGISLKRLKKYGQEKGIGLNDIITKEMFVKILLDFGYFFKDGNIYSLTNNIDNNNGS